MRYRTPVAFLRQSVCLFLIPALVWAVNCTHPNAGLYQEAADHAKLCQEVYQPNGGTPPPGWKVIESNPDSGLTGFQYAVYENEKGEVALVFRGTNVTSPADWINNLANGLGPLGPDALCPQYDQALAKAAELKTRYGDKLTLSGHSLGGGLASYAAHALNLPAYTFNPAAVGWDRLATSELATWGGASGGKVKNFVQESDPVNKVDYIDLASKVGENVFLTGADDYTINGMLEAHDIDRMAKYMDQYRDCFKDKPLVGDPALGPGGSKPLLGDPAFGPGGPGGTGTQPGAGLPDPTDTDGETSGSRVPHLDPLR